MLCRLEVERLIHAAVDVAQPDCEMVDRRRQRHGLSACRGWEIPSLEREGEARLAVGAVALAIGAGIAVDVGLVHRTESNVSIAPDLQIGARAAADGIEVL